MPEGLPNINLLPKYRRDREAQVLFFYLLILLIIIAYAVIGYYYFATKGKLQAATDERAQLVEERDILQAQLDSLVEDDGSTYEDAVRFVQNYAFPTSTLIVELTDLLPDDSYLSEYTYRNRDVELETHFETLEDVAQYTTNLTDSHYIRDVKVNSVETFSLKEEANEDLNLLTIIPRYESDFSLMINERVLKEESN